MNPSKPQIAALIAKWRRDASKMLPVSFTRAAMEDCADELEALLAAEGPATEQDQIPLTRGGTMDAVGRQDLPQRASGDSSALEPAWMIADHLRKLIRSEAGHIAYVDDLIDDLLQWTLPHTLRGVDGGALPASEAERASNPKEQELVRCAFCHGPTGGGMLSDFDRTIAICLQCVAIASPSWADQKGQK